MRLWNTTVFPNTNQSNSGEQEMSKGKKSQKTVDINLFMTLNKIFKTNKNVNFLLLFLFITIVLLIDELIYLKSSLFLVLVYSLLVFSISYYWIYFRSGK